jgi:hypothetical protein
MNMRSLTKIFIFIIICIFGLATASIASSLEQYLNYDSGTSNETMQIAASQGTENFNYGNKKESEETCWMNTGKAHKYLGYGTVLMAVTAGASGGDNSFHKSAGVSAAVLGVATCATGYYEYGNYFDMSEGFSKHNIHIVLGTLATAGFVAVAASAISNDDNSHAGLGIGSTALAAIPIIVLKF